MKKRFFLVVLIVIVMVPIFCVSASAATWDDNVVYSNKLYHYYDYVRQGYNNHNQDDGILFLQHHISEYESRYKAKGDIVTQFCGLDLAMYDQFSNPAASPYVGNSYIIDFSSSYGNFWQMNANNGGAEFRLLFSYDAFASLEVKEDYTDDNLDSLVSFDAYSSVAVQAGIPVGETLPIIGITFANQDSTDKSEGSFYKATLLYSAVPRVDGEHVHSGSSYYFELSSYKEWRYNADGTTSLWRELYTQYAINGVEGNNRIIRLNNCVVSFLNHVNNTQPKGTLESEILGTCLGFNPKWGRNGISCLSKWYYPAQFIEGMEYIYSNVVPGSVSYDTGYDLGYGFGFEEGNVKGFTDGKAEGIRVTEAGAFDLQNLIIGIFEAPSVLIDSMLNFDIFGINLSMFVKTLLTMAVVAVVVYFVLKLVKG